MTTTTRRTGRIYAAPTLNAPVEILGTIGGRVRVRTLAGGVGGWAESGRTIDVDPAMLTYDDTTPEIQATAQESGTEVTGPITGEDYIRVLVARQTAWRLRNPQSTLPPLLEWFIRTEDEQHVILPETSPAPKRETTPRRYRSAASLITERDKVEADMDRVAGTDPSGGDNAVVNLSPHSRSKAARTAGRRRFEQNDRALQRYTALRQRRDALNSKIARAQAREAKANNQATDPTG